MPPETPDDDDDPSASGSLSSSGSMSSSWSSTALAEGLDEEQMVKGLTFQTAQRHLSERFGEDAWEALMHALPRRTQQLFEEAQTTEWYPEAELRRFFRVVHEQLAEGDDERFCEIARDLAIAGINRFFRMILGLTSARFVLMKVPTIWKRLRKGPARLRPELTDDGRMLIHYEDYVYCRDRVYRLLSIANCQALVLAATGKIPEASVEACERLTMTLAFVLPD